MTLTQSAAIEAVRERLNEYTPGFYSDTEIRRWLNEGVREVARRSEWKRASKDYNVDVSVEDQYVPLDTDVIRVYRVEWMPDGQTAIYRLEYRDINAMDCIWGVYQTWAGVPGWYTMVNSNPLSIQLSPAPTVDGKLRVFFYKMPTDLATNTTAGASTVLDVPNGWEDLPVEYAVALAFRKARDAANYQLAMATFSDKLGALLEMSVRYTDEPAGIVPDWNAWGSVYDEWF